MSVFIVISQGARLAAVWTRSNLTKQLLLSLSIVAYSAVLLHREQKISRYYDTARNDSDTGPGNSR